MLEEKYLMEELLLYVVLPSIIFGVGYGVGFVVGKLKYTVRKSVPNYLGGSK